MLTNIEAERGRLMLTKGEMAAHLGVTVKTYNCYIKGRPIPSPVIEKLRTLSGRSIDYLLAGTNSHRRGTYGHGRKNNIRNNQGITETNR